MTETPPAPTSARRPSRLAALDFLRFVAAFVVVLYHVTVLAESVPGKSPYPLFQPLDKLSVYGYLGVQLFFFISGFVILMSAWGRSVGDFAASRVSRLFPAYWVSVLINAVLLWVFAPPNDEARPTWMTVLGNLGMAPSATGVGYVENVYWTLWAELRFYIWIGVLLVIGITRARVLAFTFIWPLLGPLSQMGGFGFGASIFVENWAPFFAAGMLVYLVYREGWSLIVGLLMLFNLSLCVSPLISTAAGVAHVTGHPTSPAKAVLAVLLMFGAVLAATVTPLARLRSGLLTWLGLLTYPIYLIHRQVGHAVKVVMGLGSPWLYLLVTIAVCVAVAAAIHYAAEKPFADRLRRRLRAEFDRLRQADQEADGGATVAPRGA